MIKVLLRRIYNKTETLGTLFVIKNDELIYSCSTLELPYLDNKRMVSCIPEGEYKVTKRAPSKKFNYEHFILHNVPNRDAILIHVANYVKELNGCIGVGKYFIDINNDKQLDLGYSTKAMTELIQVLPDNFTIDIKKLT